MMKKEKDIIYGRHPVVDAISSGVSLDKVIFQQGVRGPLEKEIRQLTRQANIPLQVAPKERMNRLTRANHQEVIALISPIPFYKISDVLPTIYERSEQPLIVVLDGVTDVRNFGAIARSAEVCGAHALVVPLKGSAQINADAMKTSAGALTKIPVCRENSLVNTLEFLQQSGLSIFARSLEASQSIHELDWTVPLALVVGSEGDGISPSMVKGSDELFIIPQQGTTDSLNVSVATGIMLYEAMRQRHF